MIRNAPCVGGGPGEPKQAPRRGPGRSAWKEGGALPKEGGAPGKERSAAEASLPARRRLRHGDPDAREREDPDQHAKHWPAVVCQHQRAATGCSCAATKQRQHARERERVALLASAEQRQQRGQPKRAAEQQPGQLRRPARSCARSAGWRPARWRRWLARRSQSLGAGRRRARRSGVSRASVAPGPRARGLAGPACAGCRPGSRRSARSARHMLADQLAAGRVDLAPAYSGSRSWIRAQSPSSCWARRVVTDS